MDLPGRKDRHAALSGLQCQPPYAHGPALNNNLSFSLSQKSDLIAIDISASTMNTKI